jgi:hypothetical protein
MFINKFFICLKNSAHELFYDIFLSSFPRKLDENRSYTRSHTHNGEMHDGRKNEGTK